jgi:hypothetical protein
MTTLKASGVFALILAAVLPAIGQQQNTAPVKGMASTVGLYVYPQKSQTGTQQLTDEQQCYNNAKTQTGFNPDATTTGAPATAQNSPKGNGTAKGAAQGAAISGAVGGDPAAGAARGAVIARARAHKKEQEQEQQTQQKADAAKQQGQQSMDSFKRSVSACLDARGYSVR